MNLLMSPKTADDVILSLDSKWTAKIKKLVGAYFLCESWFLWKLYFKNSYPKTGLNPPPKKKSEKMCAPGEDRSPDLTRVMLMTTSAPTSLMIWI